MNPFLEALVSQPFMQNALLGGLLASVACGVAGSYVVVRRIGYIAGGIAHAVLGGMGLAYFLGRSPVGGAIIAALVAALIIGWVSIRWKKQEDTTISALWAVGMAVGVLLIARTPGYNVDLMSYLFGNILMIPQSHLNLIFWLDVGIVLLVLLFFKQLLAVSFDEEFARLRQVSVDFFSLLLLCLVALTVVILIQVVGLILVIALLALTGGHRRSVCALPEPHDAGSHRAGSLFHHRRTGSFLPVRSALRRHHRASHRPGLPCIVHWRLPLALVAGATRHGSLNQTGPVLNATRRPSAERPPRFYPRRYDSRHSRISHPIQ